MIAQRCRIVHGCFFVSRPLGGGFPWGLRAFVRVGRVSAKFLAEMRNKKRRKAAGAPGFHPRGACFRKLPTETRNKKERGRGILPPAAQKGEKPPGTPGFHPHGACFRKLPTEMRYEKVDSRRALRGSIRVGRVSVCSRLKRGTKKRGSGGFFPRRYKELVSWRNLCYNSTRNAAVPSGRLRRFLL